VQTTLNLEDKCRQFWLLLCERQY